MTYTSNFRHSSTDPVRGRELDANLDKLGIYTDGFQGSDIASAATINLDASTGELADVTGTTTITAITLSQGKMFTVRFTGALTLTHGASLVLPGSANITTAAGDFAIFRGYASGVVRCVMYQKATGTSVIADVLAATQADQETGTSTTTYVSPGRQQFHKSAAKAWVNFNGTGTLAVRDSYNVSSVTDNGTGDYTVNFSTAFSGATYSAAIAYTSEVNLTHCAGFIDTIAAGSCRFKFFSVTNSAATVDKSIVGADFFGDQ